MKTTKLFFMAALALMTAACSNDDNDLTTQQPQKAEGITITAQLAPKTNGATTRAVSDGTDKIVAEWAVNEHIAILYNKDGAQVADATITAVDGTTGVATITFAVVAGTSDNTDCTLVYPYAAAKTDKTGVKAYADLLATQDGMLDGDLDVRVGAGKIQVTTPSLDVTTQPEAQFSIFKFTIQNISAADKTATEFKVSDGSGNVMTTVTPGSASGELYVALPVMAADGTYWFNATIDSKPYIAKATTAAATVAGKYYQTTVKMATVGDVIKADGKFYAAGTEGAVAKICYLGSDNGEAANGFNHGLALAMSDASTGCKWSTSNTDAGHTYKPTSSTFTEESGLQYNDATHDSDTYPAFKAAIANNGTAAPTGCSAWFLASGYQWTKMFVGNAGGLQTLAGLQPVFYWSSTECNASNGWRFLFNNGNWATCIKTVDSRVRACLAF